MHDQLRLPRRSLVKVPRQLRAVETVHAMLDAAARVLTQEGAEAFNTNRVAAVAGVSPGTLYQYFANRDMVLAALVERMVLEADEAVRAALDRPGEPSRPGVLRAALEALTTDLERHAAAFSEIQQLAPLLAQEEMAGMLESRLLEAIHHYLGRAPGRSPPRAATLYVLVNGCIFVLLRWLAQRPAHVSRPQLVEAMTELMQGAAPELPARIPLRHDDREDENPWRWGMRTAGSQGG